ncbi:MAG: hypothetical protein N2112_12910 [Gemmataceae bacterium]|nr:hypothetical protein [Gemmataceae bacterium]
MPPKKLDELLLAFSDLSLRPVVNGAVRLAGRAGATTEHDRDRLLFFSHIPQKILLMEHLF